MLFTLASSLECWAATVRQTAPGRPPLVPAGAGRWRINPALFAGARPGDVRVITFDLFVNDEADPEVEAMERWLPQLDLARWRPLLSR